MSMRLAGSLVLAALLAASSAGAVEVPNVGGEPLTLDVTNTSIVAYHFNNRDDGDLDVLGLVNDSYGEWLDRLNVQASYRRFRAGVRLDSAVFFKTLTRDDIAALVSDRSNLQAHYPGEDPAQKADYYKELNRTTNAFYSELHTRYRRAIFPSKLSVGYGQPGVDVTLGDFYVQLGRGLVFSVRKIDELAVDTTVRGVKVVADRQVGTLRFGATLFAGQMNPLRVDETSGRRLNGAGSPLFFGFPTGGSLQLYDYDSSGKAVSVLYPAQPSYLEDTALGEHLEVGTKWFTLGANGAMLLRRSASAFPGFATSEPTKKHDRIVNVSGSLNVPSILGHGDLYVEVAGQGMGASHEGQRDVSGYAVYASANAMSGPFTLMLEGKHYRDFFPLAANIDTQTPGFGAAEYGLVTYSQPPTAEPVYAEVVRGGSPGVCVTGGRARVDYRGSRDVLAYVWLGRYASWSEIPADLSQGCKVTPESRTDTWDAAVGSELELDRGRSHVKAWVGARKTDYADVSKSTIGNATFYGEGYVRYDIVKHLAGPFSLELQGFHRHRIEPLQLHENAWTEGENYTALQWSPHLSLIFGYEYIVKDGCQPQRDATLTQPLRQHEDVCHFVSGGLSWRSRGGGAGATKVLAQLFDSVSVFVGQRRAAVRCVSGVCRFYPPFEGARLEITSRF